MKIQKIVSDHVEGAKKKPMRVDWLEQVCTRERRSGQETQKESFDTDHSLLGHYVEFCEHMCGGFCLDMFLLFW